MTVQGKCYYVTRNPQVWCVALVDVLSGKTVTALFQRHFGAAQRVKE